MENKSIRKFLTLCSEKKGLFFTLSLIGIVFFIFTSLIYLRFQNLSQLSYEITMLQKEAKQLFPQRMAKKDFFALHNNAPTQFLSSHFESMTFCENELNYLKKSISFPGIINKQAWENRIRYLQSSQNKLLFIEKEKQTLPLIVETIEALPNKVEISEADLYSILEIFETPTTTKPQLIIQDFHLEKKKNFLQNEIFSLDMQIIKREFSSQNPSKKI